MAGVGGAGGIRTLVQRRKSYTLYMLSYPFILVGEQVENNQLVLPVVIKFRYRLTTPPQASPEIRHPKFRPTRQRSGGMWQF